MRLGNRKTTDPAKLGPRKTGNQLRTLAQVSFLEDTDAGRQKPRILQQRTRDLERGREDLKKKNRQAMADGEMGEANVTENEPSNHMC